MGELLHRRDGGVEFGWSVEPPGARPRQIQQMHGARLIEISASSPSAAVPAADGVFTSLARLRLHVFTADCLALLFYHPSGEGPIAAVHCGWRGAQAGIAARAASLLPASLRSGYRVVLGPCILPCCFEVREDLVGVFRQGDLDVRPYLQERAGKLFLDLPRLVLQTQLASLHPGGVDVSALRCTFCSHPQLPSYRRTKGRDLLLCAWIEKLVIETVQY